MPPYLRTFIIAFIGLLQGCSVVEQRQSASFVEDEGRAAFNSNYTHCINNMDSAYNNFPIVKERAYVLFEYNNTETIQGAKKLSLEPNPVLWPEVKSKRERSQTIVTDNLYCKVANVDLNHNKRLLEVQRCLESRCMRSFKDDDWWPSDRGGWDKEKKYAVEKLTLCAACRYTEAMSLAEGGHDTNFVARELDGFERSTLFHSKLESQRSPLERHLDFDSYTHTTYFTILDEPFGAIVSFDITIPIRMFNRSPHRNRENVGDPHLREIIFCDPVTDETFYITDTPVLASD